MLLERSRVVLEGTRVGEEDLESSIRMLRDHPAANLAEVLQPIFASELVHNDRALKFADVLGSSELSKFHGPRVSPTSVEQPGPAHTGWRRVMGRITVVS